MHRGILNTVATHELMLSTRLLASTMLIKYWMYLISFIQKYTFTVTNVITYILKKNIQLFKGLLLYNHLNW